MERGLLPYILIPLLSAIAIPFFARKTPRIADIIANVTLFTGLANLCYFLFSPANLADAFASMPGDGFSTLMVFTIYLVALCVAFFSSFFTVPMSNRQAYFSLIMISVAAMCGVVTTSDFFTLYIYAEVLAVTSFALITTEDLPAAEETNAPRRARVCAGLEGAIKYFLLTFPASVAIIVGLALLLLSVGSFSFESVMLFMSAGTPNGTALFAIGLILLGFLIKGGVVPFHVWVPDAYQGAFSPVSIHLAGIVTKVSGIYAVIRISMLMRFTEGKAEMLAETLMFLGMLSIAVGAIAALRQKNLKRMLAFSSISQLGYIALAAGLGTPLAIIAAIFHLFNHATFKTVLFLNSASLEQAAGTSDMDKLGAMEHSMPWTSWTSVIALLSTAGIPPLSGFWSKLLIIVALWAGGAEVYAFLALLFSIVTLAYFMVMQRKIFFGKKTAAAGTASEVGAPMLAPAVLMCAVIVAVGLLFPWFYTYLVETIAKRMIL